MKKRKTNLITIALIICGLAFMNFILPESNFEAALPFVLEEEVDCAWVVEREGGIQVTACEIEVFGVNWLCKDICDASDINGIDTCMC